MMKYNTVHKRWMKDPDFRREYEALESEFIGLREKALSRRPNIFADLGLPNPERELLRASLTLQIYKIIKQRKPTAAQVGKALGIKQPHVSALMRNRAGNFSVGRLRSF